MSRTYTRQKKTQYQKFLDGVFGNKKTATIRSGGRSRSYMPAIPKSIVNGIATAVKNQFRAGNRAGDMLSQETSLRSARAAFERKSTTTKVANVSRQTAPQNVHNPMGGSSGMKQLWRTVNLSRGQLRKAKGKSAQVARLINENMIRLHVTNISATTKFSPASTPSIVIKKGTNLSENIPMTIHLLNTHFKDACKQAEQPFANSFSTWATSTVVGGYSSIPMGNEAVDVLTSKAVLRSMKVKLLLYGAAKRQARYRVIIFRPRDEESSLYDRNGTLSPGPSFQDTFMGSLMQWVRKHATHPCATYDRDSRLSKYLKKRVDIRFDQEVVIDETENGEDALKTVLLNIWMPFGTEGVMQDYRGGEDVDLGGSSSLEDPSAPTPAATQFFINPVTKPGAHWYMAVLGNETLDDGEISSGGYKNLGYDISIHRYYDAFKATASDINKTTVS